MTTSSQRVFTGETRIPANVRRVGYGFAIVINVILLWVHFAPPLNDSFRVSYRQFLRWNDELPFVKFALSADERARLGIGDGLAAPFPVALAFSVAASFSFIWTQEHWSRIFAISNRERFKPASRMVA